MYERTFEMLYRSVLCAAGDNKSADSSTNEHSTDDRICRVIFISIGTDANVVAALLPGVVRIQRYDSI